MQSLHPTFVMEMISNAKLWTASRARHGTHLISWNHYWGIINYFDKTLVRKGYTSDLCRNPASIEYLKACIHEQHLQNIPKTFPKHPLATNSKHACFRFVAQCRQGYNNLKTFWKCFEKNWQGISSATFSKHFQNMLYTLSTLCNKLKKTCFWICCQWMFWKCFGNVLQMLLLYTGLWLHFLWSVLLQIDLVLCFDLYFRCLPCCVADGDEGQDQRAEARPAKIRCKKH